MKLVVLEEQSFMGGVQYSTFNLLKGLAKRQDIDYILLLPENGPFVDLCNKEGINFIPYRKVPIISTAFTLFNDKLRVPNVYAIIRNVIAILIQSVRIKRIIKNIDGNLILTKGMSSHFVGGVVSKLIGIKCVWHVQDDISSRNFGLMQLIFALMTRLFASSTIADGFPIKESLLPADKLKCEVIFNGVPLEEFRMPECRKNVRSSLGFEDDDYVIGHVARIGPWKGQEYLLTAFIEYVERHPEVSSHLVFVGSPLFMNDNYLGRLQDKVQHSGLSNRVRFLGFRRDLGYLLSGLDVFMYPSIEKDTSPLSVVSAMAAGLPIGMSNIPGLVETANENSGVIFFENKSVNEIVKVLEIYECEELRIQNGNLNMDYASANYSIDKYVESCLAHLNKTYEN